MNTQAITHPDLSIPISVIAQSQILACGTISAQTSSRLPAGFDMVDADILDWITTTSCGRSRSANADVVTVQ
jgi:hypothetical protein